MSTPVPQIISFGPESAGKHNITLDTSTARIIEGASWKDQSTIQIIPAGKTIPTKVALSWMSMANAPNNRFFRMLCVGMEVGQAYSAAIEQILAHPELSTWKYILTLEHDNMPPNTGLLDLYKSMDEHPEYACIGGLYWTKGEAGVPQIWGDPKDPMPNFRPQPPRRGEVVECCGTGMGFNLWRLDMFKDPKLRRPWFKTQADSGGCATQDLYFWGDARKFGYRCAIDCRILVGHYDLAGDVVW